MKSTHVRRRRMLIAIFALFIAALAAGLLASCSSSDREQEIIDEGYIHLVTYDASFKVGDEVLEGDFNEITTGAQSKMYVRVADGSLTVAPGYRPSGAGSLDIITIPVLSHYTLVGWERVFYDEDGVETGTEPWDFYSDRVYEDITLRAVWEMNTVLYINAEIDGVDVNLRTLDSTAGSSFLTRLYNTDSAGDYTLRADTITSGMSSFVYDGTTYTSLGFYWKDDEGNRTDLTVENAVYPEDATELTIYAELLEGDFTMVTQDNIGRLTLSSNSHWYLLEDVDVGQAYPEVDNISEHLSARYWSSLDNFNGIIYGNGYTISNVWVKSHCGTINDYRSIFGQINGTIDDVTFENVEYTVFATTMDSIPSTAPLMSIAFLSEEVAEGASVKNVTFANCSISIVNNQVGGRDMFTYRLADNIYWFGDYASSTVTGTIDVVLREDDGIVNR